MENKEENQEKTVEEEVNEEIAKRDAEDEVSEDYTETEKAPEEYLDLSKDEVNEEKKFQEVVEAADNLEVPEKSEPVEEDINSVVDVPEMEPKEVTLEAEETAKVPVEETGEAPQETANVIKDQDMIFLQYQCENEKCQLKFYVNNADKDLIGEKIKCYACGKKLVKKKRLFDITLKAYRDYIDGE